MTMDISTYQTKTALAFPFKGIWTVSNGGRSALKNNHRSPDEDDTEAQSFACDFTRDHSGDGKKLEDYEAFGAEVLAPADGIIVQVIDGNSDVPIGESDWVILTGNTVVIDHQNGEWSVLAHFKYDSLVVKVGNVVKQGDLLGRCGNTGNTSEPHIHYHLQDSPFMYKAHGLPAQFKNVKVNGMFVESAEPEQDQKVSNT